MGLKTKNTVDLQPVLNLKILKDLLSFNNLSFECYNTYFFKRYYY